MSSHRREGIESEWCFPKHFWQKYNFRKGLTRPDASIECNGLQQIRCLPSRMHSACVLFHNVNVWFNIKQLSHHRASFFFYGQMMFLGQLTDTWVVSVCNDISVQVSCEERNSWDHVGTLYSTFWKPFLYGIFYLWIDFWFLLSIQQC